MARPSIGDLIPIGGGGYGFATPIKNFLALGGGEGVNILSWKDPDDVIIDGKTIAPWAGTMVRRKAGSYPKDKNDGELVVNSKVRNQYENGGYYDEGLDNFTEYYYMAFAYTEDGVWLTDPNYRSSATPLSGPQTWADIQKIISSNQASRFLPVGTELDVTWNGTVKPWVVIGIDHDTPADESIAHTVTLQPKEFLATGMFDNIESENIDRHIRTFGHGRYLLSNIRQWLNSEDDPFEFTPQHSSDEPPAGEIYGQLSGGFLSALDPELRSIIVPVRKTVCRVNTAYQDVVEDRVFLLSTVEVGGSGYGDTTGQKTYPYYSADTNRRIKGFNWWLRSVCESNYPLASVCSVTSGGNFFDGRPTSAYAIFPAIVIA